MTEPTKKEISLFTEEGIDSSSQMGIMTTSCEEPARPNGFGRPTCVLTSLFVASVPPYRGVRVSWFKNEQGGTINGVFIRRNGSWLNMTPIAPNFTEFYDFGTPSGNQVYEVRFSYVGGWSDWSDPSLIEVP